MIEDVGVENLIANRDADHEADDHAEAEHHANGLRAVPVHFDERDQLGLRQHAHVARQRRDDFALHLGDVRAGMDLQQAELDFRPPRRRIRGAERVDEGPIADDDVAVGAEVGTELERADDPHPASAEFAGLADRERPVEVA